MNLSASNFSSGCESGWTNYLEQSYISENQFQKDQSFGKYGGKGAREKEEEEDLSMVSDASSGPPHYHEDDEDSFSSRGKQKKNKNKKKITEKCKSQPHSNVDDTASSPVSKNKLNSPRKNNSQNFPASHFKVKSSLKNNFGLFQSSPGNDSTSGKPGHFQGGNWE
ncbi:hypothetical protein UlMin_035402 [Ulmus minor]